MKKCLVATAVALFSVYAGAADAPAAEASATKEECARYLAAKKEGKPVELKEGMKCEEKRAAKSKPAHDHGKVHKNQ